MYVGMAGPTPLTEDRGPRSRRLLRSSQPSMCTRCGSKRPRWLGGAPVATLWENPTAPDAILDDSEALAAALIPAERTRGRVLLLTGADDQMWPATQLSDIAVRRAHAHGAGDRVEHISYPDAGHLTGVPPGVPVVQRAVHPVDGSFMDFGGTAVGNRAARRAAWRRLVSFVRVAPSY